MSAEEANPTSRDYQAYYARNRDRILARQRQWWQANRTRISARRRSLYQRDRDKLRVKAKDTYWKYRARKLAQKAASTYEISYEEASKLLSSPCAICGAMDGVSIDHDHKTGKVRGPLCHRCNNFVGYLESSNGVLKKALDWIEKRGLA